MSEQQDQIEQDERLVVEDLDDIDRELLLIAMAADDGGPMVEMDISLLTPEDKHLVLELLHRWLNGGSHGDRTEQEAA